jgi:predicted PurR-regulated permease PerM
MMKRWMVVLIILIFILVAFISYLWLLIPPPYEQPESIQIKSTTNAKYNSSYLKWEGIIKSPFDTATIVKVLINYDNQSINSTLNNEFLVKGENNVIIYMTIEMNATEDIEVYFLLFFHLPNNNPDNTVDGDLINFVYDDPDN